MASLVGNFSTETFTFPPTVLFLKECVCDNVKLEAIVVVNTEEAEIWAMRDSNSHGSRQQILSLPCLPVSAIARIPLWQGTEFPHLWIIHQRLDYCQDNFSRVPIGLAFFACRACCDGASR